MDLKLCKIKDFDDVFEATRLSLGFDDAKLAVLYVLFDIDENKIKSVPNKYLYISRDKDARKKAMLLQKEDLGHILIKYCMESFGLRGVWFNINDDDLFNFSKNIMKYNLSRYELVEYFAYAAMNDSLNAYSLLMQNKAVIKEIVLQLIDERYGSYIKDDLDLFTGIINNDTIDRDLRYKFYDAFCKLDDDFEEIKRNSTEYIR